MSGFHLLPPNILKDIWGEKVSPSLGFFSPPLGERRNQERENTLKNLSITEVEAKAILALAEKLALPVATEPLAPVVPAPTPEPLAPVLTGMFQTVPSVPGLEPLEAPVVEPNGASLEAPVVDRKAAKAAKREFNQRLNSRINYTLGEATKAVSKGDSMEAAKHLQSAMELVPSHWGSTMDRVIAKAKSLGFTKVA